MAENNRQVKELIKLRQARPSFARMISWEFSKSSEEGVVKRRKKKIKKVTKDTDEVADETASVSKEGEAIGGEEIDNSDTSEESEYDTAPEDEITDLSERLGDSVSTTDTFHSVYNESRDRNVNMDNADTAERLGELTSSDNDDDDDDDDCDDDDDDDELMDYMPRYTSDYSSTNTRRRRRSKRQRRNRTEINKLIFANELGNLMNMFDAEDEVEDVFDETRGSLTSVDINRRVPSLVELCLKASRQKSRSRTNSSNKPSSVPAQVVPYGIKRLLTSLRHDQRMLSKQLSYLQNQILPIIATDEGIGDFIKIVTNSNEKKYKLPLRSVWTNTPHPFKGNNSPYLTTKPPAFLYTPTLRKLDEDYLGVNRALTKSTCSLSAFAVTIDLMLPSTMREPSVVPKESSAGEVLTKQFHMMLQRVKFALNARYPHLVSGYFDIVIPYVMWVRGNITMATEMFHHLIKNESHKRRKAMYLSEMARMLQQFGDDEGACRFYRMATEMTLTERNITDKAAEEVAEQNQVLLANAYDTGVLDNSKALASMSHWSSAIGLPNRRTETVIAGIESFLCYHAAHCQDWLKTALTKIEKHATAVPQLLLHQSLVQALMGSESDSRRSYREYNMRGGHGVGEKVLFYLGVRERNPWKPLVQAITTQKSVEIKPLNVVWRTHLLPPSLQNDGPMEAHFNSEELNLRINEAGHLTGDMQNLLPPQRDITLDPYTGFLVINNSPSFVGEWQSAYLEPNSFCCDIMLLPTPTLISTQEDGSTVHLLFCGPKAIKDYCSKNWTSIVLYWTGPTGHVAKVNLAKELKDHMHKKTEKYIQDHRGELKDYRGERDMDVLILKILDEAYKKNLGMDYNQLLTIGSMRRREQKRAKANKTKKPVKRKKPYIHDSHFEIQLEEPPLTFGKTVVMHFKIYGGSSWTHLLVFVRMCDKAQFQTIKIVDIVQGDDRFNRSKQAACLKDEEFLCVFERNLLSFYNEFGTLVERMDVIDLRSDTHGGHDCDPCVVGPFVYGINKDRTSVWKHMIGVEEDSSLEEKVTWAIVPYMAELGQPGVANEVKHLKTVGRSVTGKLLLVHLSVGLGFMDPTTMEFVPMVLSESLKDEKLTEDMKMLIGQFDLVDILTERVMDRDGRKVCRSVLAINNTVLMVEIKREPDREVPIVQLVYRANLPGVGKEACLVGKEVGLLMSVTMHDNPTHSSYHEHVFYLNNHGQLQGILPFLAKGPRSFHCVYLHGNSDQCEGQSSSKAGWYAYMRDGKGGILGVKLT